MSEHILLIQRDGTDDSLPQDHIELTEFIRHVYGGPIGGMEVLRQAAHLSQQTLTTTNTIREECTLLLLDEIGILVVQSVPLSHGFYSHRVSIVFIVQVGHIGDKIIIKLNLDTTLVVRFSFLVVHGKGLLMLQEGLQRDLCLLV